MRDSADWLFMWIAEAYSVLIDPAAQHILDINLARQDRRSSAPATMACRVSAQYRTTPQRCAELFGPSSASHRHSA